MYAVAMENSMKTHDFWQAPDDARLTGQVSVQGSKSVAQRVLFNAFFAAGESRIVGAPDCGDLRVFCGALEKLGADLKREENGDLILKGNPSPWPADQSIEEGIVSSLIS